MAVWMLVVYKFAVTAFLAVVVAVVVVRAESVALASVEVEWLLAGERGVSLVVQAGCV